MGGVLGVMLTACGPANGGHTGPENGPPGAPTAVSAQAGDALALLTWKAPAADGGGPLLYYVVRCNPDCGGALVSAPDVQATVRGLNNGQPYVFSVTAVNEFGESESSVETVLVTPQAGMAIPSPTIPGQPRAVRATAGNGQAFVSWLPPASFGGQALQSYRITASPGGASVTVNAPSSSAVVTGLSNDTAYAFEVVALNASGEGPTIRSGEVRPRSGGLPANWVMGYYVGYQRGLYPVDTVDLSLLTHLAVGRVRPRADGFLITDFDVSATEGPLMARKLTDRAHKAGRKAIMMLGGMGEHDGFVGAASAASRPYFVRNILTTMTELGFDGVDVDWEPINLPPQGNDGQLLLALLDDLRAARPDILITVPVGWVNSNFKMSDADKTFARDLAARVDQMNVMSYVMSGNWGGWQSWHSSALLGEDSHHPTSVSSSVLAYLDAGVPRGRLGMGIGFFGSCWRGVTAPGTPLDDRTVLEQQSDNAMSYANIMTWYYTPDALRWDETAQASYLSFPSAAGPQHCNYVSFEDPRSVSAKGRWAREQALGGTIIWTINQGHLPNAPAGQQDPLLQAVYTSFLAQ
ncbi:glycosyl hydrolase [Corallococcus sp. H22C18031201]|nr:glycosyl hydrolase [Corallococcus sp. H22C18031201]